MRRGFKTEAEEYSKDFRAELSLQPHMPLCPLKLAEHLAIPVFPLSAFLEFAPDTVKQLGGKGKSAFSAVTVFYDRTSRVIVHNDKHHPFRRTSNLAHELAHGILGHPPTPPLDERGCRSYNKAIEEEADWLGATLLVPRPAAFHIVANGIALTEACKIYGVSRKLLDWRIGITGVRVQLQRRGN